MLSLATKPSLKNFVFSLSLWYLFITLFGLVNTTPLPISYWYIFYSKFSWPNFLLVYIIAIFIIPYAFHSSKIVKLVFINVLALVVYILIRYINNLWWDPDYYTAFDKNSVTYVMSFKDIISTEAIKGIQFLVIGYAYRLILDRIKLEHDKLELEKSKLNSELASLRFQLNPHFLFNALNNIIFLQMNKSGHTLDALFKLSEILRYVLDEKNGDVPLSKELQHIRNLISFEKIRYPDGLIIEDIQIENGMKEYPISPLLLATFIENAFKHGMQGTKEAPIVFRLSVNKSCLEYQITNPSKDQNSIMANREGTGLENLKKRLNLIYPDRHKMETHYEDGTYYAMLSINLLKQ